MSLKDLWPINSLLLSKFWVLVLVRLFKAQSLMYLKWRGLQEYKQILVAQFLMLATAQSTHILDLLRLGDAISSVQFSSVAQSCPTLCDPMNCSMSGLPVHHQLPEFIQTHVHWVSDAIQQSHPQSSPSAPAPNPSQHQSLFQWVNSLHEVAKVLEFQL